MKKSNQRPLPFSVAKFFALRTPLLPFTEYLHWARELEAPVALASGKDVESALHQDKERMRAELRELVRRPEIREALFLASPTLDQGIDHWLANPDSERGRGVELVIVRYFQRMTHRCTPFGIFAGHSVGAFSTKTSLGLEPVAANRRCTRFDRSYLSRLVIELEKSTALRKSVPLKPNSSLYRAGDRVRYTEFSVDEKGYRQYKLVATEESSYLLATLDRARHGATLSALADSLTEDGEVALEEAEQFLFELIDAQILTLDLEPRITGPDATVELADILAACPDTSHIGTVIRTVLKQMLELDRSGIGREPNAYRAMAASLEDLPVSVDASRLWQVDLFKPNSGFTLGPQVVNELEHCTALLRRITPIRKADPLVEFRETFRKRYEGRWVPLMEALDPESGIGFPVGTTSTAEDAPLLAGFWLDSRGETAESGWNSRDIFLYKRLQNLISRGQREWVLDDEDLRALDEGDTSRAIPDSSAMLFTLVADSEEAVERDDYRVLFNGIVGPPGVRLFGRFCYGDAELNELVQAHMREEESYRADAIYAELVHLPQGRSGNMLVRPTLRSYEIPFLGRSGLGQEHQIAVTDLHVAVIDDRVILYSKRLGKEVVPRLTSALSFSTTLGVSQFLGALDQQHALNWLGWSWGKIEREPFLPRISCGRTVISRASWNVEAKEFKAILDANGLARFRLVQAWRESRALPRFCVLVENENELLVDLDNVLSIETFCDLIRKRSWFKLEESFSDADEFAVHGPEGRFRHEIIAPLLRTRDLNESVRAPVLYRDDSATGIVENLAPGSDWLFFKLYGGEGTADSILTEAFAPALSELKDRGVVDSWFFIRYGDPEPHLRIRLHGSAARLAGEALIEMHNRLNSMVGGRLWRIELATYQREVERYGGALNMSHAERLFEYDSDAVIAIVRACPGDECASYRWQLALAGADRWLRDFGLDLTARHQFARRARDGYAKESGAEGKATQLWFTERFRKERKAIEPLIDPTHQPVAPSLSAGFEALQQRSERSLPIIEAMRRLRENGELARTFEDIAHSVIHMYCNRVMRSAQRTQEFVIYEFLTRLYESELARQRIAEKKTGHG